MFVRNVTSTEQQSEHVERCWLASMEKTKWGMNTDDVDAF